MKNILLCLYRLSLTDNALKWTVIPGYNLRSEYFHCAALQRFGFTKHLERVVLLNCILYKSLTIVFTVKHTITIYIYIICLEVTDAYSLLYILMPTGHTFLRYVVHIKSIVNELYKLMKLHFVQH